MITSELLKRTKSIVLHALMGDDVNELKKDIKRLSKRYNCRVILHHNENVYVCPSYDVWKKTPKKKILTEVMPVKI